MRIVASRVAPGFMVGASVCCRGFSPGLAWCVIAISISPHPRITPGEMFGHRLSSCGHILWAAFQIVILVSEGHSVRMWSIDSSLPHVVHSDLVL